MSQLENDLTNLGYDFIETEGYWGGVKETSFQVPVVSLDEVEHLVRLGVENYAASFYIYEY